MESEPARGLRWGLVLRAVVPVLLLALIGSVVVLVPDWMWTLPLDQRRRVIETFLRGVLVVYFLGLVAGSVGTPLLGWLAFRSWRRGQFRPWPGKTALACWGTLVALIGAEAGAAFWNAWVHRTPTLPTRFPEPTPAGQVRLAVLGESSAAGELYQPWLSVGKILAWQLQEAIPGTTYVAEVLAEPGVTLERMHQKLEGLRQRPDAVIVYCGHNEFQARFDWARRVGVSEVPSSRLLRALYGVSQRSPLCRLIYEQTTRARLDAPPMATPHDLIDSPICTPTETRGILEDFHNRLEAIVSYVEQIGAIPILVVPPGNEAGFEPNRSSLPGDTPAAESEGVRQMFKQASALEVTEPDRSLALYRDLARSHPGLAEAHFRLGRLLQRFGSDAEARGCYERARDMDGFPQRCTTSLQEAYRQVASRHGCILIDGPAELRALNPHGLLDDTLFHDAQHPALRGHMAARRGPPPRTGPDGATGVAGGQGGSSPGSGRLRGPFRHRPGPVGQGLRTRRLVRGGDRIQPLRSHRAARQAASLRGGCPGVEPGNRTRGNRHSRPGYAPRPRGGPVLGVAAAGSGACSSHSGRSLKPLLPRILPGSYETGNGDAARIKN